MQIRIRLSTSNGSPTTSASSPRRRERGWRVTYERVRSYRTVWVKKLYRDRCGCRKFYRSVAVQQPTVSVVKRVSYERVRAYRTVAAVKHYRKRCCCR